MRSNIEKAPVKSKEYDAPKICRFWLWRQTYSLEWLVGAPCGSRKVVYQRPSLSQVHPVGSICGFVRVCESHESYPQEGLRHTED